MFQVQDPVIQNVELQTPQPRRHSWPLFSGLADAGLVLWDLKEPNWVNPLRREGRCVCYRAIQRAQQFPGVRGFSRQVSIALQEVIQMKAALDGNTAVTWPGP